MLEFCKFNNVFIFNGRVGQDIVGKQTSENSSVVDYILGTAHLFESVENFEILDFNRLYSDIHCPLTLVINAKKNDMCMNRVYEQNVNKIRPWKVEKINDFRNNIDGCILQRIREKLSLCTNDMENIDKIKIDEIVDDVCDLLFVSARETFGIVGKNCQYKKNDDKLWFNTECRKARKNYRRAKRLYKHYGSNLFKQRLKESEIFYKKVMDENIVQFNRNTRIKMKNLRTKKPKEFWKIFNSGRKRETTNISMKTLFDFFKDLNKNNFDKKDDFEIRNDVNQDETSEILNGKITTDEVIKAVRG